MYLQDFGNDMGQVAWPEIAAIISDLDGVVYRGEQAIPGAIAAFAKWAAAGIPYAFVTNNATRSPEEVAAKLLRLGVAVDAQRVVTSAVAAGHLMRRKWPAGTRVYVIGAPALTGAIIEAGFALSESDAEVVVVGLDRDFSYEKLAVATRLLRRGAALVGTNPDIILPTAGSYEPSGGVLVEAVALAGGVRPLIVGKPETPMLDVALEILGTARERTLMIGDQLATDILAGQRAGLRTVLVTTGVPADGAAQSIVPQFTVDDLGEIGG